MMADNQTQQKQQSTTPERPWTERRIVKLIFIIYWVLIFEGVLRKWIFPQFNKPLFFIRDPFVLFSYYLAFRYHLWPRRNAWLKVGLIVAALFIPLVALQTLALGNDALVGVYGWRNYFFYLPLAFIIGRVFTGQDLFRLVKQTLLVMIPVALLVFWQYKSPSTAFINRTYDPQASIYLIAEGVVRPTGTFTFSQGQVIFVDSAIALLFAAWLLPLSQRPLKPLPLILASVAVLANMAMTGSRGVFFAVAFTVIAGCAAGVLATRNPLRKMQLVAVPLLLVALGSVVYVTVFHDAFSLMKERQQLAEKGEGSTIGRAFHSLINVTEVLPDITVLGKGVGLGSNAGAYLTGGRREFMLYEDEWPRLVQEGGPLGLAYLLYRVGLAGWLVAGAAAAVKRTGNPLPVLLLSFLIPVLVAGPITLQGTANGFGWLFAGFCMAANQLRVPVSQRT